MFSRLFDNDTEVANAHMDKILEAIQQKDQDALKTMFSKKAISEADNFDESIDSLFNFFQGDFISYKAWATGADQDKDHGHTCKSLQSAYDVETSTQRYRIAIKDFTVDTANKDNVGIYSLYIIKMEDTSEEVAYRGDGKWTPGINFNKKWKMDSKN
jgi:hypothetical protein